MRNENSIAVYIICIYCLFLSYAFGSAYQLNEFSTTELGRAYAGAGISGDDYSAIAYNPAGMVLMKQSGIQLGVTGVQSYSNIYNRNGAGSDKMNYWTPLPSVFGQYNVDENWFVGAGVYVPFGLSTKYSKDGFIAPNAIDSKLEVVDTNLSVAYKLNENWSFGVSAILRYIYGDMTSYNGNDIEFELDGWTGTAMIGLMYSFNEDNRLGLSYKFKSKQTVKGDFTVGNNVYKDGEASPDLPSSILLSFYTKPLKKFSFLASIKWTEWSVFDEFSMSSASGIVNPAVPVGGVKSTNPYNWKNAFTYSLGTNYYLNDKITLRAGISYDDSPYKNDSTRTFRIPDADRLWLTAGVSYTVNENIQLDFAYAYLNLANPKVRNTVNKTVLGGGVVTVPSNEQADYKNTHSNMISGQIQYKF